MSDNETPPIQANPSPLSDQAQSALRTVILLLSAITAITTFASKRDLAGFIVYVQSSEFLQVVATLIAFGTFVWGQWKIRHRSKQLASIAADPRVPDEVVQLKSTSTMAVPPALAMLPMMFLAMLLAGCAGSLATTQPAGAPSIQAAAETTAAVLDAIGQAPPATLTKTTIDDKAINIAFVSFDKTLTIIEAFLDSGYLAPGSASAIRLRSAVLATQAAINAASAAQRAGSATSYTAALEQARIAITNVQLVLAGQ